MQPYIPFIMNHKMKYLTVLIAVTLHMSKLRQEALGHLTFQHMIQNSSTFFLISFYSFQRQTCKIVDHSINADPTKMLLLVLV